MKLLCVLIKIVQNSGNPLKEPSAKISWTLNSLPKFWYNMTRFPYICYTFFFHLKRVTIFFYLILPISMGQWPVCAVNLNTEWRRKLVGYSARWNVVIKSLWSKGSSNPKRRWRCCNQLNHEIVQFFYFNIAK